MSVELRKRIVELEAKVAKLETGKTVNAGILKRCRIAGMSMARQIKQLADELATHRWIPVGERLPEHSGLYQVIRQQNTNPSTRYYYAGKRKQFESNDVITHWKKIPILHLPTDEAKPAGCHNCKTVTCSDTGECSFPEFKVGGPCSGYVPTDEAKAGKECVDLSKVKAISFLPECKWRTRCIDGRNCFNQDSKFYGESCSKRCTEAEKDGS